MLRQKHSRYSWWSLALAAMVSVAFLCTPAHTESVSPELQKALDTSKYVYIQSTRKDGNLGQPAEIWFMHHQGAVWVASPVTTYRVKRIQAGQTKARVAIGTAEGPAFTANGFIVKDAEINKVLFKAFAQKYGTGWSSYEQRFRDGLAEGSRALIKYEAAE